MQNFEDLVRSLGGDEDKIRAALVARAKKKAKESYLFDAHGRSRA